MRLYESIDSVLAQDYADVELVVVDNGSVEKTDAESYVASRDGANLSSHVFLRMETDISPGAALNAALKICSGGYVHVLYAGDVLAPDALSQYAECFEKGGAERMAICANVRIEDEDGKSGHLLWTNNEISGHAQRAALNHLVDMVYENKYARSSISFRREYFGERGYDEGYEILTEKPLLARGFLAGVDVYAAGFVAVFRERPRRVPYTPVPGMYARDGLLFLEKEVLGEFGVFSAGVQDALYRRYLELRRESAKKGNPVGAAPWRVLRGGARRAWRPLRRRQYLWWRRRCVGWAGRAGLGGAVSAAAWAFFILISGMPDAMHLSEVSSALHSISGEMRSIFAVTFFICIVFASANLIMKGVSAIGDHRR
jgi:glycosyltransferase involved in cell wall biosynthesis